MLDEFINSQDIKKESNKAPDNSSQLLNSDEDFLELKDINYQYDDLNKDRPVLSRYNNWKQSNQIIGIAGPRIRKNYFS